ncbi:MAG: class I tRNA ligase family protein [Patescibacteria group bacterium]
MEKYNFHEIEVKWQKIWTEKDYAKADDFSDKPKHYHLVEFPYPSGAGLHVGHCMGYGASDAYCRMKRMRGYNVLYPIGWDAFGLPTENYALKTGVHPTVATAENINTFKKQIKSLGYSFDWNREINTTDPAYYKWTQWIFLQFYKHAIIDGKLIEVADDDTVTERLAYQKEMPINWCPSCKIGLANEEVISGKCERCSTETEKRSQKQWILRITAYADRLINDLSSVNYLDKIKTQQINWIGRSTGAEVMFSIKNHKTGLTVFTTRPDTLFGATFMVISPEHPLIKNIANSIENKEEIDEYIREAAKKSDLERTEMNKEKTGIEIKGIKAINPVNNEEIPIFVADYVLASYGTGAIMAVPAHDDRDWEFANKYDIPMRQVVAPEVTYYKTKPIEGKPWVDRVVTESIIHDPRTNKYLVLKWKKQPWNTFITGGIEKDEDIIEAAKREIHEETGYKNVKLVKNLGITRPSFYAAHKDENRRAIFHGLLFELENDERDETDQSEKDIHDIVWLNRGDLTIDSIVCASFDYWMEALDNKEAAFCGEGIAINSDFLDGLSTDEAKTKITKWLEQHDLGKAAVNYKLRDWIFSRQHYWGEPIPIIHCQKCGMLPLDEKDLPLELPMVERYEPTDNGESPLARIDEWVNITCPKCGGSAKRETDTMPNWAGSSWYYLAYAMQERNTKYEIRNTDRVQPDENIFKQKKHELDYWIPVDIYNGGMEHTTLHLLYSRFWHKFLFDLGFVPTSEPYAKRIAHGIILGPDGQKMSKSRGNVINPDEMVKEYGADTLRAYVMFIGPYDQESAWNTTGIQGVHRFMNRVWNNQKLVTTQNDDKALLIKLNQTIVGISEDLENFGLNTVVSKLMEFNNTLEKVGHISTESYRKFLQLLSPVAPHIADEIWQKHEFTRTTEESSWPEADPNYLVGDEIEVVVQIDGKVRNRLTVSSTITDDELEQAALASARTQEFIGGKEIDKIVVVPKRLVSIATKG